MLTLDKQEIHDGYMWIKKTLGMLNITREDFLKYIHRHENSSETGKR